MYSSNKVYCITAMHGCQLELLNYMEQHIHVEVLW